MIARILITPEASTLIETLRAQYGALMFHQSGGCCDGSQPMCFQEGEFKLGSQDVCLGTLDGCEFWMNQDQFQYWKHTQLTISVVEGRGSSFSLEIPLGKRFIVLSRIFTEEELQHLAPVTYYKDSSN